MIRKALLAVGAVTHAVAALYYLRVFWKRSKKQLEVAYLLIAALTAGWFIFFVDRLHLLPASLDAWLLWGGAITGLAVLVAIYSIESQRP
jgi:tryptophan-rich sensory protein